MAHQIKLGDEVEDVTAMVRGVAIGRIEYLDGNMAWLIQPPSTPDGDLRPKLEVPEAYARRVSDGVRVEPKLPTGFRVEDVG